ncbi:hypothetical protein OH76DRAFT_1459607 [Lentinus brumalis]|uniref:SWIM-type domain-containing protein n=1 Tax=Lentinus brumalis TaxID=2498619 RepID=A0A371CI91_9APHY|nr:hypothetical protein OH76DRAFT_1459607 [Polyporus brumalis]
MYTFCHHRGLAEAWGYLWTSWYSPQKWPLWARSPSERISRLWTTMTVEKHWQELKGDHLHHLLRPRIDQLTYILVHRVTPSCIARSGKLEDTYRLGRSRPLTTHQLYFKRAWKKLQQVTLSGRQYATDISRWTCNCGAQKFNAHHLCKHLVQAVREPDIKFWRDIYRHRTVPLYRHPALKRVDDITPLEPFQDADDGSITEGDDHVWLGDRGQLKTYTAGWEAPRSLVLYDRDDRSSSPIVYAPDDSEDEEEEVTEHLARRAKELREFADIIDQQLPLGNRIWISSMADRNVGKDVSLALQDIKHLEEKGRRRETTWARAGDREGQRRLRNTMGYQPRAVGSKSSAAAPDRASSGE